MEKPSKTFLIRGGVALGILALIFLFQTDTIQNLFSKKEKETQAKIESLEELIRKDSNTNGIPDWEERFWGLDPFVISTNGRLHTDIIAERKTILSSQTNAEKLTETERLARELFIVSTMVGGSTDGDLGVIGAVSERAADEFLEGKGLPDEISLDTITRIPTNKETVREYTINIITTLESKKPTNELEIIATVSETQNMNTLSELSPIIATYKNLAQKTAQVRVPTDLAEEHLVLVNSINNMGRALENFGTLKDDAASGVIGFYQYSAEETRFNDALTALINKSNSYFIIQ